VAFKIACNIFDAAEGFKATNAELTDTEDALQAELDALKHRNVSLETDLATTRAALARANAAAASAAALARPRSADSHSSSPQPLLAPSSSLCTSPSASMHADRHVLRRTLSDESDAEARTSGGLSRDSGVVAGVPRSSAVLPAIAEERSASAVLGRAKADAPSLDDLDGLFKELMHDYATHTTRCVLCAVVLRQERLKLITPLECNSGPTPRHVEQSGLCMPVRRTSGLSC
jgi:hypothetical protein